MLGKNLIFGTVFIELTPGLTPGLKSGHYTKFYDELHQVLYWHIRHDLEIQIERRRKCWVLK